MLWCLLVLSLAGCGDTNQHASYDPDRGEHPDGWVPAGHAAAAWGHLDTCTPCHGEDFGGGISKVACTQCHLGNEVDVHPLAWGHEDYSEHADYVRLNGTQSCANVYCHGAQLEGVAGSGPSCSVCHIGGPVSVHPTNWRRFFTTAPGIAPTILPDHGDYVNANGASSCVIPVCHGSGVTATVPTGVGSTGFTGTVGTISLIGVAGAGTGTAQNTGLHEVRPTARACAACHF